MLLYLDNIRGFSNQVIDLNDINFLVGENSTGKSTVLSILHFFSDPSRFSFPDFKSQFVDFGPFDEIVNSSQKTNKSFQIGFFADGQDSFLNFSGHLLLRYSEKKGFPSVDRITWLDEGVLMQFEDNKGKKSFGYIENVDPVLFSSEFSLLNKLKIPAANRIKGIDAEALVLDEELNLDWFNELFFLSLEFKLPEKIIKKSRAFVNANTKALLPESIWIDPIRSKPQRVYEPQKMSYSSEGNHIPSFLKELLSEEGSPATKKIIKKIEAFGKKTGLFEKIIIDNYRKTKHAPFSINVKLKGKIHKITNVGYGVSQILPIMTEIIRRDKGVFLIQQPEVHLHPKSQASFGEFIFEEFWEGEKQFLIETHSDFIIDRFRTELRKERYAGLVKKVNILFFEKVDGFNKVTKIELDNNADYSDDQPKAFREFFLKEQMLNLGME